MSYRNTRKKKCLVTLVLFCFVFSIFLNSLILPIREAKAQVATAQTFSAPSTLKTIWEKLKEFLYKAFLVAGSKAIHSAVMQFLQNIAHDVAVDLASAGSGQKPLIFGRDWKNYLKEAGQSAAGEAIGRLSEPFEACGINLCKPSLDTSMIMRLGLFNQKYQKQEPRCEWKEIEAGWKDLYNEVAALGTEQGAREFLNKFQLSFQPGQNDLGFYMTALDCVTEREKEEEKAAEKKREEGQGFSSVEDIVSGNIKTPAAMIEQEAKDMKAAGKIMLEQDIAAAYVTSIAEPEFWAVIVSTFTNTLVSKLSQRLFKGLWNLGDMVFDIWDYFDPDSEGGGEGTTPGGRKAAQRSFSEIITPPANTDADYAVESNFAVCPGETHAPDQCVIDSKFTALLSSARRGDLMTVGEAIDNGFLHGNWFLIPKDDVKNQSYKCYNEAYCYSNLIKLRQARIITVGWEIAAEKSGAEGSYITLSEVVDNFDNDKSNYYHLIDPDWVVKTPPAQCRALAYSSSLIAPGSQDRAQVCVDAPTCLSDDGAGNCDPDKDGYGYCVREKNIWRFDGVECPSEYNSCLTFSRTSDDERFSYLRNSVDYGGCNESSVGCKWYSTSMYFEGGWQWSRDQDDRIYLNRKAEQSVCDSENEGCTEFIKMREGVNLVYNGSFEDDNDGDNVPDGWLKSPKVNDSQYVTDGLQSYLGSSAIISSYGESSSRTGSTQRFYSQWVKLSPNTNYTVSAYLKDPGGNLDSTPARIIVEGCRDEEGDEGGITEIKCMPGNTTCHAINDKYGSDPSGQLSPGDYRIQKCHENDDCVEFNVQYPDINTDSYTRVYGTFNSGRSVECVVRIAGAYTTKGFLVDGVKLEKAVLSNGEYRPSAYIDYGHSASLIYLKKAPDYYGCEGYNKILSQYTDEDSCVSANRCWRSDLGFEGVCVDVQSTSGTCNECSNFAFFCEADEVGCERYTPTAYGSPVTSVIQRATSESWNDECPAICNGYQSYQQEPTNFESALPDQKFIATTGESCTEVGCDEFTNLDQATRGGETREYYSYFRQCIKPDSSCATFYTWEGSDTTGFQLKTYNLKAQGQNIPRGPEPTEVVNPQNLGVCESHDDIFSISNKGNCKEFYNQQGDISYHFYENTVSCTDECYRFRRTQELDQNICENIYHGTWTENQCISDVLENDCTDTGGQWTNEGCIYNAYPAESRLCQSSSAGCRAYTGNAANNLMNILNDGFEQGDNSNWQGGRISNEATAVGGHSLQIQDRTTVERGRNVVGTRKNISSSVTRGKTYVLSFWVKGPSGDSIKARFGNTPEDSLAGNYFLEASLNGEWQFFESKKPVRIDWSTANETLLIHGSSNSFYIDNILLQEVVDSFLMIKNSWTTPEICSVGDEKGSMLGCREYKDRLDNLIYLRSFSSICRDESVGCEALIDTQNSISPFEEEFNTNNDTSKDPNGLDNFTVPEDELVFMVNDPEKACNTSQKGCSALGLPILDKSKDGDEQITGFDTVYILNNPDKYSEYLCQVQEDGCEEYIYKNYDDSNATVYFRDPSGRTCEYKEGATVNGQTVSGWFKSGTDNELCPGNSSRMASYELTQNTESGYDGWVGICSEKYDRCTKFVDPADTSNLHKDGYPYYYINDRNLNREDCNGTSEKDGCILLQNDNELDENNRLKLLYSSYLSYEKSDLDNGNSVSPVTEPSQVCQSLPVKNILEALIEKIGYGQLVVEFYEDLFNPNPLLPFRYSDAFMAVEDKCGKLDDNMTDAECLSAMRNICSSEFKRDSNTILKVKRDRVCGEWLACKGAQSVLDPVTNKWKRICEEIALCDQYSSKHPFNCKHWVNDIGEACMLNSDCNFGEVCDGETNTCRAQRLTLDTYQNRDTSWSGLEYSGYSLYDRYPIEYLKPVSIIGEESADLSTMQFYDSSWRLAFVECPASQTGELNCDTVEGFCINEGSACGLTKDGVSGRCLNHQCAYGIGGQSLLSKGISFDTDPEEHNKQYTAGLSCKGFPEENAPFPSTQDVLNSKDYQNISTCYAFAKDDNGNIMYDSNGNLMLGEYACECNYNYVLYSKGAVKLYKDQNAGFEDYSLDASGIYQTKYEPNVGSGGPVLNRTSWDYKGFPVGVCSNDYTKDCDPNQHFSEPDKDGNMFNFWKYDCEQDEAICFAPDKIGVDGGIKIYQARGNLGFCLDEDLTSTINADSSQHPCITWLPLEVTSGSVDINNNYSEAGFDPNSGDAPTNSTYEYCADPTIFALRHAYSVGCTNSSNSFDWVNSSDACPSGYRPTRSVVPDFTPYGMEYATKQRSNLANPIDENRIKISIGNNCDPGEWDRICYPEDNERQTYRIYHKSGWSDFNTCVPARLFGTQEFYTDLFIDDNWSENNNDQRLQSIYISMWADLIKSESIDKDYGPGQNYLDFISSHCVTGLRAWEAGSEELDDYHEADTWENWDNWCRKYGFHYDYLYTQTEWAVWRKFNFTCGLGSQWEWIEGFEDVGDYEVIGICTKKADAGKGDIPDKPYTNKLWSQNEEYIISASSTKSGNDDFVRTKDSIYPMYGSMGSDLLAFTYPLCRRYSGKTFSDLTIPDSDIADVINCPRRYDLYDIKSLIDLTRVESEIRSYDQSGDSFAEKSGGVWHQDFRSNDDEGVFPVVLLDIFAKIYLRYALGIIVSDIAGIGAPSVTIPINPSDQTKAAGRTYLAYESASQASEVLDVSDSRGTAPQIGSVIHYPSLGQYKLGSLGDITINTKVSGPHVGRDGYYYAKVKFYGWADHNQMPIKRVMVNWGDGEYSNQARGGRYKNHKPYCSSEDQEGYHASKVCEGDINLTCFENNDCIGLGNCVNMLDISGIADEFKTVNDGFGNAPRACEPGYFEFEHIYFYNPDNAVYPCPLSEHSDKACNVYQVGVQVKDNWDWCNGNCFLDRDGCYGSACDNFTDTRPWDFYEGTIYVLPEEEEF